MSSSQKSSRNLFIFIVILAVILAFLVFADSYSVIKKNCNTYFDDAYEEVRQSTYDSFKQKAYDYYEKQNHVSNRATISIGKLKEKNALEVLSVSDTWVKITDADNDNDRTTRWVEFNATGVYIVDMSVSEFVIDNEHHFVIAKLKTPQLGYVKFGDPEVYHYEYQKGVGKINGNINTGVEMAINDLGEASDVLTEKIENNEDNLSQAKKSAEYLVKTFIKNVNPDMNLKDSDIQIEFV